MPIAALVMSALLLNRGWIPFDLFDRDTGAGPASDSAGLPAAGNPGDSDSGPSTITADAGVADPDDVAAIRKFRVAVAPPEFDEDERLGAIAFSAFHAYLLEELGAIPHLEIIELTEPAEGLTPAEGDFYLEVGGERAPDVPPIWTTWVRWTAMREGTATWTKGNENAQTELMKIAAQEAAASLRRYPFPPMDSRAVELQSTALDSERTEPEHLEALLELHDILKRFEFVGRDERRMVAVAGVAVVLNSQDAEVRAQAWKAMEDVEDLYLVGPLVDSLLLEPSDPVRVEAAKLLARDYEDDPRAQSTLLHALVNDKSPLVRSHARWATLDAAGRRQYLATTLGNPSLPDSERLEMISADVTDVRDYIDERALRALMNISSRARPSSPEAGDESEPGAVAAGDVVPLLLEFLRDRTITEWVRADIASALSRHLDEPNVDVAFRELSRDTSSAIVRSVTSSALMRRRITAR